MGTLISALLQLLFRILGDEVKACMPWLTAFLLRRAVQKLPSSQRDRFEEEWASHIEEVPGQVKRLWDATGFIFAAHQITFGESVVTGLARRGFDFLAASMGLTAMAPLFLVIAVLTKIDCGGKSAITRHVRIGARGKPFTMYQFRIGGTAIHSVGGSPLVWRPSRLGLFLVRFSLHEMPQMVNVWRGK